MYYHCFIRGGGGGKGFAPHISPFTEMRDLGGLLGRAGYTLTTVVSVVRETWNPFVTGNGLGQAL